MCGITGIWRFSGEKVSQGEITNFNDSLAHRGPDASGTWIDESTNLALGHRRLSILDLSENGDQPMFSSDENYVLVFNGEIFNFVELKKELVSAGYTFKSSSDAEVLIYAYDFWGVDCLNKFNGMWAFALYNREKKELFLARDRYGIKPLYFTYEPNKLFAFSSETIGFNHIQGFNKSINEKHLNAVYQDSYILEGKGLSIYNNINLLKQGHFIRLTERDFIEKEWYQIPEKLDDKIPSFEEAAEEYQHLFKEACKIRLRSDVDIAQTLSGGLDSSSVFAMGHSISSENSKIERVASSFLDVFHMSFENKENDERQYAYDMTNHFGYDLQELTIKKGDADFIIDTTAHMDGLSHTPQIQLMQLYRSLNERGFKVSMDGHGVDEQLYGYRSMVEQCLNHAVKTKDVENVRLFSKVYTQLHHPSEHQERDAFWENESNVVQAQAERKVYKLKKTLGLNKESKEGFPATSLPDSRESRFGNQSFYDQVVSQLMFNSTLPSLLKNFDKTSMRYGVELRAPFMDYRLVEYLYKLPYQYKIGNGFTKRILRESMKGVLPEGIVNRTYKIGLTTPFEHLVSKEMVTVYQDYFNTTDLFTNAVFDVKETKIILDKLSKSEEVNDSDKLKVWKHFNAQLLYTKCN